MFEVQRDTRTPERREADELLAAAAKRPPLSLPLAAPILPVETHFQGVLAMSEDDRIIARCHHEAGHAVASVVRMKFIPTEIAIHHVNADPGGWCELLCPDVTDSDELIRSFLVVLYAGEFAQEKAVSFESHPQLLLESVHDDLNKLNSLMMCRFGNSVDSERALARSDSARLVNDHWPAIQNLACKLISMNPDSDGSRTMDNLMIRNFFSFLQMD